MKTQGIPIPKCIFQMLGIISSNLHSEIRAVINSIIIGQRARSELHLRLKTLRLNETDLNILGMLLAMDPTPSTLRHIAAHVGMSNAGITGAIDRLAQQSFVYRKRSNRDRREVYIYVTEAGRAACLKGLQLAVDTLESFIRAEEDVPNDVICDTKR